MGPRRPSFRSGTAAATVAPVCRGGAGGNVQAPVRWAGACKRVHSKRVHSRSCSPPQHWSLSRPLQVPTLPLASWSPQVASKHTPALTQ